MSELFTCAWYKEYRDGKFLRWRSACGGLSTNEDVMENMNEVRLKKQKGKVCNCCSRLIVDINE